MCFIIYFFLAENEDGWPAFSGCWLHFTLDSTLEVPYVAFARAPPRSAQTDTVRNC